MKKRSKRHVPEQIVKKLRDAEVMLNNGKSLEEVLKVLEVSEATFNRWRNEERRTQATYRLDSSCINNAIANTVTSSMTCRLSPIKAGNHAAKNSWAVSNTGIRSSKTTSTLDTVVSRSAIVRKRKSISRKRIRALIVGNVSSIP